MDYTITLTDTEKKSMEYIALDVDDWITNAAQVRANIAKNEIIALNTAHCNANSIAIAVGEDKKNVINYHKKMKADPKYKMKGFEKDSIMRQYGKKV